MGALLGSLGNGDFHRPGTGSPTQRTASTATGGGSLCNGDQLRLHRQQSSGQTVGQAPGDLTGPLGGGGRLPAANGLLSGRLNGESAGWRNGRTAAASLISSSKHTMPASWIDRSKLGPVAAQSKPLI